jgi:hypothetical protein
MLRKIMTEAKARKADAGPAADNATTPNDLDAHKQRPPLPTAASCRAL